MGAAPAPLAGVREGREAGSHRAGLGAAPGWAPAAVSRMMCACVTVAECMRDSGVAEPDRRADAPLRAPACAARRRCPDAVCRRRRRSRWRYPPPPPSAGTHPPADVKSRGWRSSCPRRGGLRHNTGSGWPGPAGDGRVDGRFWRRARPRHAGRGHELAAAVRRERGAAAAGARAAGRPPEHTQQQHALAVPGKVSHHGGAACTTRAAARQQASAAGEHAAVAGSSMAPKNAASCSTAKMRSRLQHAGCPAQAGRGKVQAVGAQQAPACRT